MSAINNGGNAGAYDVVFIGHLSKDIIILHDGKESGGPGGAAYYGAVPAARVGAATAALVRVARGDEMVYEDWPEKRDALPLMDFFKCDAAEAEILTGLFGREARGKWC